jgi:hypothetical protein
MAQPQRGGALRRHRTIFLVLALLCAGAYFATYVAQGRALDQAQARAVGRARAVSDEVDGSLATPRLDRPIPSAAAAGLDQHLQHAMASEGVWVVRVWSPAGALRYTTLPKDRAQPLGGPLRNATRGAGRVSSIIDAQVMTTYVPLRAGKDGAPFGAVEIQQPYLPVLAAAGTPWTQIRLALVGAGALLLVLLALGIWGGVPARRAARQGAGFLGERDAGLEAAPDPEAEADPEAGPISSGPDAAARAPASEPPPAGSGAEQPPASDAPARAAPSSRDDDLLAALDEERARRRSDNERAGARVADLEDQLGSAQARLLELQAAVREASADQGSERVSDLEQQLQAERLRAGTAESRLAASEVRVAEVEGQLRDVQALLTQTRSQPEEDRSRLEAAPPPAGATTTALDPAELARLEAELDAALERAREAEDRAAQLQDRLSETDPLAAALNAWRPTDTEPAEDEDGESLRSRLARNASARKGRPTDPTPSV